MSSAAEEEARGHIFRFAMIDWIKHSRNHLAFAGKSVPQEKSRAVFRKKIRTV